jgi:hypothetical protein
VENKTNQSKSKTILRLAALIFATTAAGVWLFAMIMQVVVGLQKGQDVLTLEGGLLAALVLLNGVGTVLGWWRKAAGTRILVIGGLALSIFSIIAAGRNRALAVTISGLPFLLSGILLWFSTRSTSNHLQTK